MADHSLRSITSLQSAENGIIPIAALKEAFRCWYWFILSLGASLLIASIFLRYATPRYLAEASLLIRDDSRGANFGEAVAMENLGLPGMSSSIDNEVEILKSRSLVEGVVDTLQLNVSLVASGRVKQSELYGNAPVTIRFLEPDYLKRSPGSYQLTFGTAGKYEINTEEGRMEANFGDTIVLPHGKAVLHRTNYIFSREDQYAIVIADREETVKKYLAAISVSAVNKFASVITISVKETIPSKGEAVLHELIDQYLRNNVNDKNRVADNTIDFINRNLSEVASELSEVEKSIEQFRSNNRLLNVQEESRQLIQQSYQASSHSEDNTIKLRIVEAIAKFARAYPSQTIPTSMVQQDGNFVELVKKYNELLLLRTKSLATMTSVHPVIASIDNQLSALRSDLLAALDHQQRELTLTHNLSSGAGRRIRRDMAGIPAKERIYLDHAREQQIKQELYLFLLKKRVETSISRSSTVADAKVIDAPQANATPVTPNRQLVFLISACLGLGAPFGALYISRILTDRIVDKQSLLKECDVPLIGEVSFQTRHGTSFSHSGGAGLLSEQFRALRANILFVSAEKQSQTILVTSGIAGEGKSFIAANLAHAFALNEKKVLLLELDLRKPSLYRYLRLLNKGFTDYMLTDAEADLFIQQVGTVKQFYVMTSGAPPPNPEELLLTTRFEQLISALKRKYDHIIIDTPPVGLVADAHLLRSMIDLSLYVVRQNFSYRQQIGDLNRLFSDNRLSRVHLVLNGVPQRDQYQYRHYFAGAHQVGRFTTIINKLKQIT